MQSFTACTPLVMATGTFGWERTLEFFSTVLSTLSLYPVCTPVDLKQKRTREVKTDGKVSDINPTKPIQA